ncbi:hypothetical protein ACHAWF_013212 [Thalassiosira exigua]
MKRAEEGTASKGPAEDAAAGRSRSRSCGEYEARVVRSVRGVVDDGGRAVFDDGGDEDDAKGLLAHPRRLSGGGIEFVRRPHARASLISSVGRHGHGNGVEEAKYQEAITLPQSTHTLLFTERVCSVPFGFALLILAVSVTCLVLALWDNLDGQTTWSPLNVPPNVTSPVRVAKYASLIIAVLMEEEIPTGLYLLRMIPKSTVEGKLRCPYWKFAASAMARLAIGYLFLLNAFLVLVQSTRVLDMFYDMMALSFVSMLDDIAFKLAHLDVLGKRMRNAASNPCFAIEFERRPYVFRKKMTVFVKVVFLCNFFLLLGGMIVIDVFQASGTFQCNSITVTFGEDIWEDALVETESGALEQRILVYSHFNGVYEKEDVYGGRPRYREIRKTNEGGPFDKRIGAVIMYCPEERSWVFTHEHIHKTREMNYSPCNWLLRSPITDTFDLLGVTGAWDVWVGVIENEATMLVRSNDCMDDNDCNFNGRCSNYKCQCTNPEYEGVLCERRKPCLSMEGELGNFTSKSLWTVSFTQNCQPMYAYGRAIYYSIDVSEQYNILYSGSRWLVNKVGIGITNISREELDNIRSEYHAFWNRAFGKHIRTVLISDPTSASTQLELIFIRLGKQGSNMVHSGSYTRWQIHQGEAIFAASTTSPWKHAFPFAKIGVQPISWMHLVITQNPVAGFDNFVAAQQNNLP